MRIGEKCIFTVDMAINYGNIKLKTGHRYTGYWGGGKTIVYKRCRLTANTVEPIKKTPVVKVKAPTASDYKNFGDLCFEVAIRYRDDWRSVISGKQFQEGDWNGLQAGHGCSRTYWDTRHEPFNCHAITSGENYQMSLGNPATILRYWDYVRNKYGADVVNYFVMLDHKPMKLSISYLQEDCKTCYSFLRRRLEEWDRKYNTSHSAPNVIKWRCENLPKAKAAGVLKVLDLIEGRQI